MRASVPSGSVERMSGDEPAGVQDVHDIASALPEVTLGTSWGDKPTYKVRDKGFVIWRGEQRDAVDPDTGALMDDVMAISVPGPEDKEALVADGSPFFTTPHFDRSPRTVLLRERDLPRLTRAELEEVLTDAWASRAPARLVREHLGR